MNNMKIKDFNRSYKEGDIILFDEIIPFGECLMKGEVIKTYDIMGGVDIRIIEVIKGIEGVVLFSDDDWYIEYEHIKKVIKRGGD